jgi:hypothetical protein
LVLFVHIRRPAVTDIVTYSCLVCKIMSDADDDERRSGRPQRTSNVNVTHFKAAQRKYPNWNKEAQTEFERLFEIDKKKRLTNLANPVEHAVLSHLCVLKEGYILDFFL